MRAALLRCKEMLEQFSEDLPELLEALRPAFPCLDFLFQRLAETSGAVQSSALLVLAKSWATDPGLFAPRKQF